MSQNVGEIDLSLILNSDKFKSQLKNIDSQASSAASKISSSLSKIGKAVAVAFSVTKIVEFGKACLDVATETSNAWIGLNSILTGQGKNFDQAKKFINEYVSDGLVPLNNAVASYKNLALRGYSSDQIQKTMNALKNSATFARQSTYSLGDAVQTATEGLKNENSVVVDNAGVTKNVAKMWEDYAKSIGKTTNNLTQAEKIQAEVNGILEETKFQSNDAAIYANTYAGKIAQLNSAFTNMKVAIGNVIQPIAKLFVPIITTAVNAVTKLFTALSGLLSLFGLKADSVETVSSGIGDLATSAGNASDAISDVGDSAKKAGKDAKKASNNLAAFDNLNVLPKDTDSSSSGSGSGSSGGGAGGLTDTLDVSTTLQEDTSLFDGLIERVKGLASIFKEGFDISFGDTNFDGIIGHLNGIKDTLIDIWTDPKVLNSANNWVNTVMYSLGQQVGAIARIGTNWVEGFVGSIDKYLSQNVDRIKGFIVKMFDISSKDFALVGNFYQALGEISDVWKSDTAKQIGADIIAIFANPLMSAIEFIGKFVVDFKSIFMQPIIDNVGKIKEAILNTQKPIETVLHTIGDAFTYIGDKWNEVYDNHIHPLMDSLKRGLSDTFSKFLDVYNQYVAPALQRVADKLKELWEQHLRPLVDKVAEFCSSIFDLIKALWDNILKPVIDWIIQNVLPVLVPIFEGIWNTLSTVFGYIADAVGGIIDTFRGLIDFLTGVFTGDWNKAWEGIKTFFNGIWEAIKGILQAVWSAICGIVETAINIVKGVIETVFNAIKTIITNIWNGISTFFSNIWNGIKTMISNVIDAIKNNISKTFENIKKTLTTILNTISTTFKNIWNTIKTTITNVINAIKTTITNIFNAIKDFITNIWNNISNTIKNVIKKKKNTITSVLNAIKTTWSNIWNGIKSTVTNIWNGISSTISNTINTIKSTISNVINSIKSVWDNVWNGMRTTIENVFNGIWNTIRSVVNSILGGVEKMANGVINGINGMIRALNNLSFDVPDWVPGLGGKKFGFNIGTIGTISLPRLAEGGYVKANTPQLAMIGDNKTQGELVAPEDKILDMIMTALKMKEEQDRNNQNREGNTVVIKFDGTMAQLVRVLKPELDNETSRRGTKLVIGGTS